MPSREFITTCSLISISDLFLIIGIPCWIVGSIWPFHFSSISLFSLPIFPMTSDKRSYWTLGDSLSGQEIFSTSNPITIPFLFELASSHMLTAHLIHNLWGYNINLSIFKGNNLLFNFNVSQNSDLFASEYDYDPLYSDIHSIVPVEMVKYGDFLVRCPFPTLITKQNKIDQVCRNDKTFCSLHGQFESISLGNIFPTNENYSLHVYSSKFIPNNFIETPQIYLGFWKLSNGETLIIFGSILTSIGLLLLAAVVVIFFVYFMRTAE